MPQTSPFPRLWKQVPQLARRGLRLLENEKIILYVNGVFRMGALLALGYHFIRYRHDFTPQAFEQIRLLLLLFLGYNLLTAFTGMLRSAWFLRKPVKFAQVLVEIGFYTVFYYLSQDARSDVYLLYFLPLFIAVRFLSFWQALAVALLEALGVALVMGLLAARAGQEMLWGAFWLRELFLLGLAVAFGVRFRPSFLREVQEDDNRLAAVLKSIQDGVYVIDNARRLLFVNDTLQGRHGPYVRGQPCSAYFQCRDELCGWSPAGGAAAAADHPQQGSFIDRSGRSYTVAVSTCPLPDEDGRIVGAIAFVQEVDRSKKLAQRLRSQVRTLNDTRATWLQTYLELNQRLAGLGNPQALMDFLVEEASRRLHAESAQLLLRDGNRLSRRAIAPPLGGEPFDETYLPGVGITSDVLYPGPDVKHGHPVRNNAVDKDPHVVARHLCEYAQRLPSRQVKHLLAVPLNRSEDTFGVLRVVNKLAENGGLSATGFTQEDEDFLAGIAAMAALSLENTRLLAESQRRVQEISALYRLSQSLGQPLEQRLLLQGIVDEARAVVGAADKVSIHLLSSKGDLLAEATSEPAPSRSGLPPIRLGEGIAGKAIQQQQTVYVPDTRIDPDFKQRGGLSAISMLVTPLRIEERTLGTLSMDSSQAQAFSQDDQRFLEALATLSSTIIEKERLYSQERLSRQQADTTLQVSQVINSSLEQGRLLETVLDEVRKLVPYDSISIQLVQDGRLRVIACRGFPQPEGVKRLSFPLDDDKFPNYQVIQHKRPFIVQDVNCDYAHIFRERELYQSDHICAWMGIPMIHRGEVIGMIAFDHHLPGYYQPEMQELAQTLVNQAAIAIVNARLLAEKDHEVAKLDTLYKMVTLVNSAIELDEVLPTIVSLATQVAHSDHTGVVLVDEGKRLYTSFESGVVGAPLHLRARPRGVTRQVIESRQARFFDELGDNPQRHNRAILEHGFKSYAGLPVIASNDRLMGVLFVHSQQAGAFGSQAALLQAFCQHAAIAIEKAVLFRQMRQQKEMLQRLVEASYGLIRHLDMDDLLAYSARQAGHIFDVEDGSLYLRNDERGSIDLLASSAIPPFVWPRRVSRLDGPGLTAHVARSGEMLNFGGDEYKEHPAWSGRTEEPFLEHLEYLPSHECRSLLIGPLEDSQGKNLGVLKLENKRGEQTSRRFSEFEVSLHRAFSSQIGIAVERARFFQRLDENARREARDTLGYDLHEIASFVHGALKIQLEIAKEELNRGNIEVLHQELQRMAKAAEYVSSMLRWIYNDLLRNVLDQDLGLAKSLEGFAEILQVPLKISVSGQNALPVEVEYALYKIGLEALNNVARYAGRRSACSVELEKQERRYCFTVRDHGPGFNVNEALNRPDSYGLKTIQRWAKTIDAHLEIISTPGGGTLIRIEGELQEGKKNG